MIDPKEYMQDGWDRGHYGAHPYQRGSRHNRYGMIIMWSYYILIIGMVTRLIIVLNS